LACCWVDIMTGKLSDMVRKEWIFPDLGASSKEGVLSEIARRLSYVVEGLDAAELLEKLIERENKASTGADQGLAIPHAQMHGASGLVVSIGCSSRGVEFGALDNERSKIFFTIVSPARAVAQGEVTYLQAISHVCKLMRSASLRNRILAAKTAEDIFDVIVSEEHARESRLVAGQ
jgi:PTS system fructose-specific IIC component